jgi:hypothetical protein
MFDKDKDKDKKANNVLSSQNKEKNSDNVYPFHISYLEDGEFAFMEWLDSEDKTSSKNHLVLKRYEKDKECIVNDNTLNSDIKVKIDDGAPFCTYCQDDSCAHVGYTICVMQLFERKGVLLGENESIIDLFKD